jgi:pimeloyl-ACP methyl ester carboxylesterase
MEPAESELHVRVWGEGEPVLLIHGTTALAGEMWSPQRVLSDQYRLLVPDRRGYGASPPGRRVDLSAEVEDLTGLLGDGAHLVGFSYGGALALLVAARRPDLVRSLAVIEPPVFRVARGHPAVDRVIAATQALYATVPHSTPEEFWLAFLRIWEDERLEPPMLTAAQRRGVLRMMQEQDPASIDVPLGALAAGRFPKLVLSGEENDVFEVVCDALAQRLGGERVVVKGAGHGVRHPGVTERLATFLAASTAANA